MESPRLKSSPLLRALLLSLFVVAGLGCPPKQQPPPTPSDPTPPPQAPVAIDSLVPDSTPEGRAVTVAVEGRGFEQDMDVFVGSVPAAGVDVLSPGEFTFRATEDLPAGTHDLRIVRQDGEQAVARGAFTVVAARNDEGSCTLRTVTFAFNESALENDSRSVLAENARCIESRGITRVRLEGHADERGSTIYNLSLGQRRAESAKAYLLNVGVGSATVDTLSYGEERPADTRSNEAAWAKNRRVEFVIVEGG